MSAIQCKSMTMQERKEKVARLAEQFSQNENFYTTKDFVEAECRNKFIDPFLECLGWDVKNEKGARHDKTEVITEDRVVIDNQVKHPDYTLCYGGERKIYVEAKQPSVDLKDNPEPALQVRRYAYTSKMPIAILTDFQEIAIYDTRIKPSKKDTAATARIEYYSYKQYDEHFEDLYSKISWEAVDLGKFDTYYESAKDKKGTATVDNDILKMIESWRTNLAEDIALHNAELDEYNLTSAVQKIIDRILFLRICEDKQIEEYNQLKKIVETKTYVWEKLKDLFSKANEKFNAGLFASDSFLDCLIVEDKTLTEIINELYYPECQYEFSVLPVQILGSIYERFLGKIIRFTRKTKNGHSVEIIEKPEVQKAGGVYYTPPYIVKYIVEQTIGQKIKGKTPEEISAMHFVDPACGSGSFLVGAYKYLLEYHLEYYDSEKNRAASEKKGIIYKDSLTQNYKLTVEEKKLILLNNIFGVDIDAQAVEVTKLSLFLQLLENEGKSLSKTGQSEMFRTTDLTQTKILPSMTNNIKCGNSLIGSDYYSTKDLTLFDIEAQRKLNAFDWQKEFPQVFDEGESLSPGSHSVAHAPNSAGNPQRSVSEVSSSPRNAPGFDCVIGNPPYVSAPNQVADENLSEQREYLSTCQKYKTLYQKWDLYIPFVEKSLQLLKNSGIYSAIIPYPFTNQIYAKVLREEIIKNYNLTGLVDLNGTKVFEHATVTNCIPVIAKEKSKDNLSISHINEKQNMEVAFTKSYSQLVQDYKTQVWNLTNEKRESNKFKDFNVLGDYCYISYGLRPNSDEKTAKGEFVKADLISNKKDEIHCRKYIEAKDIEKYAINRIRYLEYGTKRSPAKLVRPTFSEWFDNPKIFFNRLGQLVGTVDYKNKFIHNDSIIGATLWQDLRGVDNNSISSSIKKFSHLTREEMEKLSKTVDLRYLLAVMNSKYASVLLTNLRGGDYHIYPEHIRNIPIPPATKEQQEPLIKLVDQMLLAKQQLSSAKSDADKKLLTQRTELLDAQINAAVYKLYNLTTEEIAVVEGA